MCAQFFSPQPLRESGVQNQPGCAIRLGPDAGLAVTGALAENSVRSESFKAAGLCTLKAFQRMLCLMAAASEVIPLGLLHTVCGCFSSG